MLIPFTMQMAMIIIGGYVLASTPAVYWVIQRLASVPSTPRGAIAFVAFFSMSSFTSLISWGFSLIFSGLLVRELVKRMDGIDYRAIGAAAYLGLGSIWALGLSSSAALMMATKGSIPPALFNISGLNPPLPDPILVGKYGHCCNIGSCVRNCSILVGAEAGASENRQRLRGGL